MWQWQVQQSIYCNADLVRGKFRLTDMFLSSSIKTVMFPPSCQWSCCFLQIGLVVMSNCKHTRGHMQTAHHTLKDLLTTVYRSHEITTKSSIGLDSLVQQEKGKKLKVACIGNKVRRDLRSHKGIQVRMV